MTVTTGAAIGAAVGVLGRRRVTAGIGGKMGAALPAGSAGIVAMSNNRDEDAVSRVLTNALQRSSVTMDKVSPMTLKAGLTKAQAGLGQ